MTDPLRAADITDVVEQVAPLQWADDWDNVGLQLGHPDARVYRAAVALEVTGEVLRETLARGADLLITHHPLIFSPLRHVRGDSTVGDRLLQLAGAGTALYCAHTNFDRCCLGPSAVLADELELVGSAPLEPLQDLIKLAVYVPLSHVDAVRNALGEAGAGGIGAYSDCTFTVEGRGTFRPGASTDPFIGARDELSEVREGRVETVLPRHRTTRVLAALYAAHPYEEPAFDLIPLDNQNSGVGMGRIGDLPEPRPARDVVRRAVQVCEAASFRTAGDLDRRVQRVAVCGGAGGKLGDRAAALHAELFITGDVSHHGARDMVDADLIVLDAGHAATERPAVARLASYLDRILGPAVEIIRVESSADPWEDGCS